MYLVKSVDGGKRLQYSKIDSVYSAASSTLPLNEGDGYVKKLVMISLHCINWADSASLCLFSLLHIHATRHTHFSTISIISRVCSDASAYIRTATYSSSVSYTTGFDT